MPRMTGPARAWLVVFGLSAALGLTAAKPGPIRQLKLDPQAPLVGLFAGEEQGDLSIRMVALNDNQAHVFIQNQTDHALTVALPKAAIGVHVLPQFGPNNGFFGNQPGNNPFGNPQGNANNSNQNNFAQSIGGVLQGNNGNGNGNQPFGFPSIPAEVADQPAAKEAVGAVTIPAGLTVQVALKSVCLNYGRPEPSSRMTYKLVDPAKTPASPALIELLASYGPRINQEVMQAAAWHLANDLEWNQVAGLPDRSVPGTSARLFTPAQVRSAQQLVVAAEQRAEERTKAAAQPVVTQR
jgi:hypothetical protein